MSHKWKIEEYFKDGYFYIRKSEQWEIDQWGFAVNGRGDLIYNTCRKIIETGDESHWAEIALASCVDLLLKGRRWPEYMDEGITEKYWKGFKMTRDPWILMYACAVHLKSRSYLKDKIPWWLYSPTTWAWHRALLNKPNCYKFWKWLLPTSRKQFVRDLDYFREWAYNKINETPLQPHK